MRFKSDAQRKAVMAKLRVGDIVKFPNYKTKFKVTQKIKYIGEGYFYKIVSLNGKEIKRTVDDYEVEKVKQNPSIHIHSAKWRSCVKKVKSKGIAASPEAVCTKTLGYKASVLPAHRRK